MELLELLDTALQKYDILTIILVAGLYLWFKKRIDLVHSDVKVVDSMVNNRPFGEMSLSQEVTEIHQKIKKQGEELSSLKNDVSYLKTDITKSRIYNVETFEKIDSDITDLKNEICKKKAKK